METGQIYHAKVEALKLALSINSRSSYQTTNVGQVQQSADCKKIIADAKDIFNWFKEESVEEKK